MAPPHQPFILPGQPPPPPPDPPLPKSPGFRLTLQRCSLVGLKQVPPLPRHLEHLQEPSGCFSSCPRAPGSQAARHVPHTNWELQRTPPGPLVKGAR